jgi:hypothetical protein
VDIKQQVFITTNNAFQNLGAAPIRSANAIGNLSVQNPTIEQMNAAMTEPCEISSSDEEQSELIQSQPTPSAL